MKELTQLVEARKVARHVPHAVATVLRVEGSSYRRPGARMLVDVRGRVAGSVSGGCLEKNVVTHAQQALLDGRARLLSFDTTDQDDLAFGTSLGCQGKIWIGLEIVPAHSTWALEQIVDDVRQHRVPVALATRIMSKESQIYFSTEAFSAEDMRGCPVEIGEVLESQTSRFVGATMHDAAFLEYLSPPLSLVLLGGNHDVAPMVRLAIELGHEVTVIDRRPDFAVREAFPGAARVIAARPAEIAKLLAPDERTVAVLMNHHYDTDRDALVALLPLGLPYIGMLGPKRRTERILSDLESEGHDVSAILSTIHGPAGLDIGAETPEQIALAVLAEIQSVLAGRSGGHLRDRNAPIHAETGRLAAVEPACALPG